MALKEKQRTGENSDDLQELFFNPAVGHLHCHALKMHFPFATRKMGAQIFKAALDFKRSEPFRGDLHLTRCPLEPSPFSEKMRASQNAE